MQAVLKAFASDPTVEWAEPDYIARAASVPDDPLLPGQWGLAKVNATAAWNVVTGTQSVVIAVLDSGIDKTHIDLSGKLWVNPGEIAGNGIDDDNNGYVDDVNGWDFVNNDNDPSDDNGHGTQVAGIAAAETNNAAGMAGMCWNCKIMPVKVMQGSGVANYSDITAGVLYAAQKGAEGDQPVAGRLWQFVCVEVGHPGSSEHLWRSGGRWSGQRQSECRLLSGCL